MIGSWCRCSFEKQESNKISHAAQWLTIVQPMAARRGNEIANRRAPLIIKSFFVTALMSGPPWLMCVRIIVDDVKTQISGTEASKSLYATFMTPFTLNLTSHGLLHG